MLIDINEIIVNDRIRKDFGNLEELAEDIKKNGLINPLTVNGDYKLLAGERRLRACKLLGWNQVDVRVVKSNDEAHDLAVEMSENNLRRNFTGSELAEGIRRQMALESEKAKERMSEGGRGANICTPSGKSRDKAAEQFGISGEQARKTLYVDDHRDLLDPADFADWDEGKLSTNKAFQRIKAAKAQAERELRKASIEVTDAQMEAASLKKQVADARAEIAALERQNDELYAQKNPEPEVIEREVEVVREVVPEDVQKRINNLERENRRLNDEYQQMWRKKREADAKLDQANELLGEKERNDNAQRDIEHLTVATNTYLRNYGGKAWAFDQFYRVDEVTQREFIKAITNLAAFAQGIEQLISDKTNLEA